MKLELRRVELPLAAFTLQADAVIEGQVVALFGPSGAGKTTLLDLVAGLIRPRAGTIVLDDAVLTDAARGFAVAARQRGIGYVPQDLALFPHMSVRRNCLYGAPDRDGAAGPFSLTHVSAVLEIGDLLERRIGTLSGGEKQRVALARAFLAQPRLLLLDEPLSGLDEALKSRTKELLLRAQAEFGVPMLYVTHAAEEILALCDEVVVLERGRAIRQGAPAAVFETAQVTTLRVRGMRDPASG